MLLYIIFFASIVFQGSHATFMVFFYIHLTAQTPGAKIACIVRCANLVSNLLNLNRSTLSKDLDSRKMVSADEFLPVFIYVVLQAKVR